MWIVADETIDGSETGTSFKQALYFKETGFNLHDTMIFLKPSGGAVGSNLSYWQAFEYMFVLSKGIPKTANRLKDRKNRSAGTIRKSVNKNIEIGSRLNRNGIVVEDYGFRMNVWEYQIGFANTDDSTNHPAPFPEQLAADHIYTWSNEGELIYDCFGGSGTTVKKAHQQKRNWIMSEISPQYCELAQKRIDPYLKQTVLF